ncbi:hypothetical protein CPLU01_15356 [Colletotrichum plurivorum]|uniref:Uncharacterized protein n=1 Tax=Colletotrichum plurivorum TaxID=2175906 RepID=A0A8H6JCS2_9PEZI|nr:hypothetical protein CPLU01_15356 [Colletotrichum plurivorum]
MSFPTESKLEIFAEETNLYKATLETSSLEQSSPPSSWYDAAAALDTWAVEYDEVLTNIPETMYKDNERSGSGDTGKACVDDGSTNNDSDSSYDHDTESENCTQELVSASGIRTYGSRFIGRYRITHPLQKQFRGARLHQEPVLRTKPNSQFPD